MFVAISRARAIAMAGALVAICAVPAAADVCYLTTGGSSCGPTGFAAGGAIFQQIAPQMTQPSGTTFNEFVQIQHGTSEQGYNTNATPQFNEIDANTHAIRATDVPVVQINGLNYRQFFLEINESATTPSYLSLDKLQVFLGPNGYLNSYTPTGQNNYSGTLSGIAPIYNLDTALNDSWIKLDYSLNNNVYGSNGVGDLVVYIPDSLFGDLSTNPYVYLYSQFGSQYCCRSDAGGFEEWWVNSPLATQQGQSTVPEPTALLLFGSGLILGARRLRIGSKKTDEG